MVLENLLILIALKLFFIFHNSMASIQFTCFPSVLDMDYPHIEQVSMPKYILLYLSFLFSIYFPNHAYNLHKNLVYLKYNRFLNYIVIFSNLELELYHFPSPKLQFIQNQVFG